MLSKSSRHSRELAGWLLSRPNTHRSRFWSHASWIPCDRHTTQHLNEHAIWLLSATNPPYKCDTEIEASASGYDTRSSLKALFESN